MYNVHYVSLSLKGKPQQKNASDPWSPVNKEPSGLTFRASVSESIPGAKLLPCQSHRFQFHHPLYLLPLSLYLFTVDNYPCSV
jgi:hypothetical protein